MEFTEFLATHGVNLEHVQFHPSHESNDLQACDDKTSTIIDKGMGLFANGSLQADQLIVRIPSSCLMSAASVAQWNNPGLGKCVEALRCEDNIKTHERRVILAGLLLASSSALSENDDEPSDAEEWIPYMRVLPSLDSINTPVMYKEGSLELRLLSGTGVDASRAAKLNKLQREFHELEHAFSFLDARGEELAAKDDAELSFVTFERFLWADAVFWSRVISFKSAHESKHLNSDLHMVPLIDFANHSETPEMHWRVDPSDTSISLFTTRDVPSATELHISYGEKPNSELLFIHGFTVRDNVHDCVVFQAPVVEAFGEGDEDAFVAQVKMHVMQSLGVAPLVRLKRMGVDQGGVVVHSSKDAFLGRLMLETCGILDEDSLLVMMVSVLDLSDFASLVESEGLQREDVLEMFSSYSLLDVLLLRVWTVLLDLVESRLQELSDSEAAEEVGIQQEDGMTRQRLQFIEILREGHYKILTDAYELMGNLQAEYSQRENVVRYLTEMGQ
ncbi:hypothetical protein HDU78_007880 [Chytriomyces hyalinus]|nr:hypothetical protein HDU78_007880 [Chytriomyces hyalinus]